jgi:hypothetical protein
MRNKYLTIAGRRFPGEWTFNGSDTTDDFDGLTWVGEPRTKAELDALWPEVQAELHAERVQRERQAAYRTESDPIAMKMLRGEATEAEWLAKIAEIKERIK